MQPLDRPQRAFHHYIAQIAQTAPDLPPRLACLARLLLLTVLYAQNSICHAGGLENSAARPCTRINLSTCCCTDRPGSRLLGHDPNKSDISNSNIALCYPYCIPRSQVLTVAPLTHGGANLLASLKMPHHRSILFVHQTSVADTQLLSGLHVAVTLLH